MIQLFLLKWWKEILVSLIIVAGIAYISKRLYDVGYEAATVKCEMSRKELRDAIAAEVARREKVEKEYDEVVNKTKEKVKVVTRTITKEVEKPIYKECKLPETGTAALRDVVKELNSVREKAKIDPSFIERWKNSKKQEDKE